ncbi:hypothetical protein Pmar_PMAR022971 [Perkinsus marinus ATCC 50983]|uniref:Uncharacterized protein n=1 Tax=Perkinsus marinus (strain ATCC 50983 / TXsc) TaxID=423536 RepID=C5LHS0_PERM5|nr:hypothetical protein Pmar_PMAR022971 [Perkinsus marinus ATCC 50983]EER03674.1 hypothetical protein Pmar_PMAR022971 [Perkinsus marinus ATCC 50983]|eukprot:XP_002771858.1 hypothetical protein Pmar_PMAR022971 [Perkinsus marinus ATCC 50983]
MPHSTAALIAGLQHKTATNTPPMEMLSSVWEYLTCLVWVPTLSPASVSAIEAQIGGLPIQEGSATDLVACDGRVVYCKSTDDARIFAMERGCDTFRSLESSALNVQLAGIEPGSGVLHTFRWNHGKRVMELRREGSADEDQQQVSVSCWTAEGLLRSKPLLAFSDGSLFVANSVTKGSGVLTSIDIRPRAREEHEGEWFKIFAPVPSELIQAISVHACKDTTRLLCAMEDSIWVADISPPDLRHGTEITWSRVVHLPQIHRVHQVIGLTDHVAIGLVSYFEDGSSSTLALITIDLINGDVKEVVSMKEEESAKVFLTRNCLWMASASEEEGPLVKVVDLEWV